MKDSLIPPNMKLSKDIISYKALKTRSIATCDFCDKKFNNRYDSIVHNASHIIIPLWSQTLYNCKLCNVYTTTSDELESHNARKHTITVNKPMNCINLIKTETVLTEYKYSDVNNEINEINGNEDDNDTVEYEPVRNRLKFEEDVSPNGLIRDLVTQCNVKLQLMKPLWPYAPSKYINCNNVNKQLEQKYNSIDYSSLIKPGIFSCKYCTRSYPNRFSLIKHETDHIRILQWKPLLCLYCDKYIAGNYKTLNTHIAKRHPDIKEKKCKTFNCKRCGLQFRKYKRHVKNYHIYDCLECGLEFNNFEQHASHKEMSKCSNYNSKILKVCDLCLSFMKRQVNVIYVLMGDKADELGVRYPCDNCGKKYFVLKTVKRTQKRRCRYLDNEKRLKNIQLRLKKLNLLHKF